MNLILKIWRQSAADKEGKLVTYDMNDVSEDMSFLEMLDVLNERLTQKGEATVWGLALSCKDWLTVILSCPTPWATTWRG